MTWKNLLDAWFIAGTATNAYDLFDFVKLKRVTIRAIGLGQAASAFVPSATVAVEFYGLGVGVETSGKQKSNTSLGYDTPAYVTIAPDPRSQAAQYHASNTGAIFGVRAVDANGTALPGAVIDVELVFRNAANVNPTAVATARAGLTAGEVYFGGLDGAVDASTQARSAFVPRA